MSYSPELERGYRRLLACYPRAFRRQNADEIIGVLLATAAEDQRRVGLAESADLIRGALRMRLRPAGRPPGTVRGAIRLMCAGAASSAAVLITEVMTGGRVMSAIAARYPAFAAAHSHEVTVSLTVHECCALLACAVWAWLAWANTRGREWARLVFGAFLVLITLSMLSELSQGSPLIAPADFSAGVVEWLIAAAAAALLFTRQSWLYYRPETAGL
jgi:membrane-bound metal-dependent hydrolase YbcI (DUF457 family)